MEATILQGIDGGEQVLPDLGRLFEILPDMVLVTTPDGTFVWANRAVKDVLGWADADLCGMDFLDLVARNERDRASDILNRLAMGEHFEGVTFYTRRRDGDSAWIEWSAKEIDGKLAFVGRDMTPYRRESELVVAEQWLLKAVVDRQPLSDILFETCRSVERLIPGCLCSIKAVDSDASLLRNVASGSLPEGFLKSVKETPIDPLHGGFGAAAYHGSPIVSPDISLDERWRLYRDVASQHGLKACWVLPLLNADGVVVGTISFYFRRPHEPQDWELEIGGRLGSTAAIAIERQRMDDALSQAKVEAEKASQAKSQFIAYLSHELRTPLNAVIGFAGIIEGQDFGPIGHGEYVEAGRDIRQAGEHLLRVINDILDLSRIEAGRMPLVEEEVDIVHEIQACLRMVKRQATSVRVNVEAVPQAPIAGLRAEARRVRQILLNLLSNAIQHTDADGLVRVGTKRFGDGRFGLLVEDNGVGIAPEDIPQILEPFGQVIGPQRRHVHGSGLGLPLTLKLMELHGGTLTIESAVGVGTTMTAVFPASRVLEKPAQRS